MSLGELAAEKENILLNLEETDFTALGPEHIYGPLTFASRRKCLVQLALQLLKHCERSKELSDQNSQLVC